MATWGHCTLKNQGTPAWGAGEWGLSGRAGFEKGAAMEGMKMFLFCKAELTRTQLSPSLKSGGFSVGFSVENRLLEYTVLLFSLL